MNAQETRARLVVAERSSGICEVCHREWATDWHHRLNRSQGGMWAASNGLHLCRRCHRIITTHPTWATELGYAVEPGNDPAATPIRYLTEYGPVGVLLDDNGGMTLAAPHEEEI